MQWTVREVSPISDKAMSGIQINFDQLQGIAKNRDDEREIQSITPDVIPE
jgi:hypothetical protein